MQTLTHNRGQLTAAAAASLERLDLLHPNGYVSTNSTYRSRAEQHELIRRWKQGGTYNRPPYLYLPAMQEPFPHSSGLALDTSEITFMLTVGKAHGWYRPYAYDLPHFEYDVRRDQFVNEDKENEEMIIANVKNGNFYLVIGKEAHALGAASGARESGIPIINYVDDWAVSKLRSVVSGIGNH